jgi:hypothetical protein
MGKKTRPAEDQREGQTPAVPPPDDPRLRHEGADADRAAEREAARKRLEALKRSREMPSSEGDG